ncbi:MAG: endonuclease/exonuclease/phosphatase family protein [Flavobacteriales bacterium]|nr:endonuclease/exonuclease/phosphatase family protein [Flavobacteriales bacterium]
MSPLIILGQDLGEISFGTDSTLEVITWNIEWFPKNGMLTVDSVGKIIESLDADLIGIQEIDDTIACRQMIDDLPGYELFMDNEWFGGLAYVYKTSAIDVQSIYKIYDTSPYWNVFPRSPLVIEFSFEGNDVIVINNHFKCCGDGLLDMDDSGDEENRRFEASQLLKTYIDEYHPLAKVLVIGDLNDLLIDDNEHNVFQMFLNDPSNYSFADYDIASGTSENWSFYGWPSHLDHILVTNELFDDLSSSGSEVVTLKIDEFMSDGWYDYDYYISDHRPVGIKLAMTNTSSNTETIELPATHIFPNPSMGNVFVDLSSIHEQVTLQLMDLTGNIIQEKTISQPQIAALDFIETPGVYVLSISNGYTYFSHKLLIQ